MKTINAATTIEDLQNDPHAFGLPTLHEFTMNKEKWMGRPDEHMIALTDGPRHNRKNLRRIKYFIKGIPLPNEEAVEKALADHGYTLADINLDDPLSKKSALKKVLRNVDVGGGLFDVIVNFFP